MAERFGGAHSPGARKSDGAPPDAQATAIREARAEQAAIRNAGRKAWVLFVPGPLLAVLALNEGAASLALSLVAAAAMLLAAWLLREGLRAEAAFAARPVARKPALPRKMLATALTGVGVALAALTDNGIFISVTYGIIAGSLHLAAFGIDPLRDKRMEGIDTFQQDRVAQVVAEAETYLTAMADHIAALKDRALDLRIAAFQAVARKMIRTVEEDPRDLTEARKYLSVYLLGARDASVKFADLYARTRDAGARTDFEALLTDLETNFAARTDRMLGGDRDDMDIEIKVLRDRLSRDGITPQ